MLHTATKSTGEYSRYGLPDDANACTVVVSNPLTYGRAIRQRFGLNRKAVSGYTGGSTSEGLHSVLVGTNALGRNSWNDFMSLVVQQLLDTEFEHGTQYKVRVESIRQVMPSQPVMSTMQLNTQEAAELTQHAITSSGLTHEQLATAMGVSRQTVQNWLKGKGGISSDNQERLSQLIELFQHAKELLGTSRQVARWLLKPWREDGPSPLALLADARLNAVRGQLLRSEAVRQPPVEPILEASGYVPRRAASAGYSPPWLQPKRTRQVDPEEGLNFRPEEETSEYYRDTSSTHVTGLALA
jgi:transcriptional regulator with XRE-family HTH domain